MRRQAGNPTLVDRAGNGSRQAECCSADRRAGDVRSDFVFVNDVLVCNPAQIDVPTVSMHTSIVASDVRYYFTRAVRVLYVIVNVEALHSTH